MSHFQMDCQGGSWGKKPCHQSTADQQMQAECTAPHSPVDPPSARLHWHFFFSLFFKENHEQRELPCGHHLQSVLEVCASCLLTASQKDDHADSC